MRLIFHDSLHFVAETKCRQRRIAFPVTARAARASRPTRREVSQSGGRAADEAAARRKQRACPDAEAEAAGFVKRPPETRRLRRNRIGPGRTPDSRSGPVRRKADLRIARRHRPGPGASAPGRPGRTGFRPGSCEPAGPRTRVHGLPGGTFGFGRTGSGDFGPGAAKRRTARASALTGSHRGNPRSGLRFADGTPEAGIRTPGSVPVSKTPTRKCLASQAERCLRRDSGGRRRRRPPLRFRRHAAIGIKRHDLGSSRRA